METSRSKSTPGTNPFAESAYYVLWLLLHITFTLVYESFQVVLHTWKMITSRLWSCWPKSNSAAIAPCLHIANEIKHLRKLPRHVGFLLVPEEGQYGPGGTSILNKLLMRLLVLREQRSTLDMDEYHGSHKTNEGSLDLQGLARLIVWSYAANVRVVSVYDYHGQLKKRQAELLNHVEDELEENAWTMKHIPATKFHYVPVSSSDENFNGLNLSKTDHNLHIIILSREDGKPQIMEAVKNLAGSVSKSNTTPKLNEEYFDTVLHTTQKWNIGNENGPMEPDILTICGNIQSTLGFLPWHIRLTEIHWIPKLPFVEAHDFVKVLRSYSGCQQRFGT